MNGLHDEIRLQTIVRLARRYIEDEYGKLTSGQEAILSHFMGVNTGWPKSYTDEYNNGVRTSNISSMPRRMGTSTVLETLYHITKSMGYDTGYISCYPRSTRENIIKRFNNSIVDAIYERWQSLVGQRFDFLFLDHTRNKKSKYEIHLMNSNGQIININ